MYLDGNTIVRDVTAFYFLNGSCSQLHSASTHLLVEATSLMGQSFTHTGGTTALATKSGMVQPTIMVERWRAARAVPAGLE